MAVGQGFPVPPEVVRLERERSCGPRAARARPLARTCWLRSRACRVKGASQMSARASKTGNFGAHPKRSGEGAARQEPHTLAELEASVHIPADELITTQQVPEGLDEDLQWAIERRPFRLIGGA